MRWFLRWQKVGFRRVISGALAPIGPANGAGPRPVRARPARGRRTSATDAAPCTVADLQGPRQRMAWRGLQRLVRPMVNTQRRSVQRPSVLQNRGARCEQSWPSLRHGSWTTVIWTRTGGIGSNKTRVIAISVISVQESLGVTTVPTCPTLWGGFKLF